MNFPKTGLLAILCNFDRGPLEKGLQYSGAGPSLPGVFKRLKQQDLGQIFDWTDKIEYMK